MWVTEIVAKQRKLINPMLKDDTNLWNISHFGVHFVIFLSIHILTHTHTGCACVYLWIQRKKSRNESLKHYFNKLVPIVSQKDRS